MAFNNNYQKSSYSKNDKPDIELNFIKYGFTDEKGNLREELLTKEAQDIAKHLIKEDKLSNSQLRAFFNEVKAINNRLDDKKENFEKIYYMLLMLKSKIEYRASKQNDGKKMKGFKKFLTESINYIQTENKTGKGYEAFKNFVIFFETVVGYCYGEGIR